MESTHPGSKRPPKKSPRGAYGRVLFVDDEGPIRAAVARTLSTRGFLVDVAASAAEALLLAENAMYHVVATDLCMPGEDGLWLIRKIQSISPSTIFVVMTGHPDVSIPTGPEYRASIASVVAKPYDIDELVDTLHRSIRLAESRSSLPPLATNDYASEVDNLLLVEDIDSDADLVEAYLGFALDDGKVTRVRRLDEALATLERRSA